MTHTAVRVLTWNLEWTSPRGTSPASRSIRHTVQQLDVDIACLPASRDGSTTEHGASGRREPRHPARPDAKVVLWSRWPMTDIDGNGPDSIADLRR
jgi:hypothetical protein